MKQRLEPTWVSLQQGTGHKIEQEILRIIGGRKLSLEDLLAAVESDESTALSSVRHLIEGGRIALVVVAHAWGTQLNVELTEQSHKDFMPLRPLAASS